MYCISYVILFPHFNFCSYTIWAHLFSNQCCLFWSYTHLLSLLITLSFASVQPFWLLRKEYWMHWMLRWVAESTHHSWLSKKKKAIIKSEDWRCCIFWLLVSQLVAKSEMLVSKNNCCMRKVSLWFLFPCKMFCSACGLFILFHYVNSCTHFIYLFFWLIFCFH